MASFCAIDLAVLIFTVSRMSSGKKLMELVTGWSYSSSVGAMVPMFLTFYLVLYYCSFLLHWQCLPILLVPLLRNGALLIDSPSLNPTCGIVGTNWFFRGYMHVWWVHAPSTIIVKMAHNGVAVYPQNRSVWFKIPVIGLWNIHPTQWGLPIETPTPFPSSRDD